MKRASRWCLRTFDISDINTHLRTNKQFGYGNKSCIIDALFNCRKIMKILIIGNGGREHALAWKVAQSPLVTTVFVAPGNAGTALEPKTQNIPIGVTDTAQLLDFARQHHIDLTIIGPEAALAAGVADQFQAAGLRCFGPTQSAARLETSKAFAKDFMQRHRIPTANYATFTDVKAAQDYVQQHGVPIVIKASGLAAGKGVVIATTLDEANTAITDMLSGHAFGAAGEMVVIEEYLTGEEVSFIVMVDGDQILPLATSQDHKARDNGDRGPNTGGMGAYSPSPIVTPALQEHILRTIIKPTIQGLAAEGCPYQGFLYAGLMIGNDGNPKVLEYNCRLGDPETQPILLRLKSDLVPLCMAALEHQLEQQPVLWDSRAALGVVLTAGGYPNDYDTGEIIHGLALPHDANSSEWKIFHAGTRQSENQIVTAGGRVLCVTALGDTVAHAQAKAYEIARQIHWSHIYYRTDIGHRAITRER